jgi:hypothetical protein
VKRSERASLGGGWHRFQSYRQLRRLLRPEPRRGVVVATCHNEVTARLLAGRLADAGVKSFVFMDDLDTSELPGRGPARVIVRPEEESAAREVLD